MTARALVFLAFLAGACGSARPAPAPPPLENKPIARPPEEMTRARLRDVVLGVNAHVIVLKASIHFPEYRDVLRTVEQHPNVAAAEAFQFVEGLADTPRGDHALVVKGVDPARVDRVQALPRTMVKGTTSALRTKAGDPPALIVGDGLAKALGVSIGDAIAIRLVQDQVTGAPVTFRVAGMFHTGFGEYDDRLTYTSFAVLAPLLGHGDVAIGVEAVVRDLATSEATARDLEKSLGGAPYHVMDWFELNKNLLGTRE